MLRRTFSIKSSKPFSLAACSSTLFGSFHPPFSARSSIRRSLEALLALRGFLGRCCFFWMRLACFSALSLALSSLLLLPALDRLGRAIVIELTYEVWRLSVENAQKQLADRTLA